MGNILEVRGLVKSYRGHKALDGVDMNVPEGAIYGFVGRNGAGKTTLIRVICGLQPPTAGGYVLYGRKNTDRDIARSRRRIGAVAEAPAVYSDMTAEENLRQQCRILGLPSFDGIGEILRLVGLGDTGKKKAGAFSLGMRQRLGLAVALTGDPDLVVLDEPMNGLDPQGIVEIRELILKLNRERRISFIISSHMLDELARVATHYGFIDRGRIVREINAVELEAACRKRVRVEVSETRALARALDKMGVEYTVLSETQADIYAGVNLSELAEALKKEGGELRAASERDESLESYYIGLVGGGDNA